VSPLRIAVIGAGYMGRRHAQKVAELAREDGGVALAGVADVDFERAGRLALELGTRGASEPRDLFADAEAAIVAVPTVSHFEVVRAALEAGLDVLVEKPLAATLREGEELLEIARQGSRMLQVGHVEWFNAAIPALLEHLRAPRFAEAQRFGRFSERVSDVDVVRDLMIHDLDILQRLLGEEPAHIEAIGVAVLSRSIDVASARIEFPGGCVANLTASRVAEEPVRRLRLFQSEGFFTIDFLAQSASISRQVEPTGGGPAQIETEELKVDPEDALLAQLRNFAEAVRTRKPGAGSGAEALGALRTALRVIEAMLPSNERS
jgi:predicted dehydrogenase